jgi:hypothetical protein
MVDDIATLTQPDVKTNPSTGTNVPVAMPSLAPAPVATPDVAAPSLAPASLPADTPPIDTTHADVAPGRPRVYITPPAPPISTPDGPIPIQSTADAPLGKLKAAGFSAPEIATWATDKRQELVNAGFDDGEIDHYFSGAVQPPKDIPKPLLERIQQGTSVNNFFGAVAKGVTSAFPDSVSAEDEKKLQDMGVLSNPADGKAAPLRLLGDATVRAAAVGVNTVMNGFGAGLTGLGVGIGEKAKDVGMSDAGADGLTRDAIQLANAAMMVKLGTTPMTRIDRGGPQRTVQDTPVGGLPKGEDFLNAAHDLTGGNANEAVQQKLLTLYKDQGIHPAEVAHDAHSDVTITQDMVSSDTDNLPAAYNGGGEPPIKPPAIIETPAAEPPELPPGSFDAAKQKILDKISIGAKDVGNKLSWAKFYTHIVDDLHPINLAVKEATGGEKLPTSEDAYKLARLTRGTFGKADHFLEHGTFDFNTYKTNGPGLAEILKPVRDDLNGLRAYLASKRAMEIEGSGRISGMDLDAARTVADAGKAQYGDIADQLQTYQHNVLKYLKDSGVLSEKSFDAMSASSSDYIPFYRVMGDGLTGTASKGFGPGSPVKALKGSVRDIVDPLESIIKNTYAFTSIAERNAVGIKLIDTLKAADQNPTYTRTLLQNPDYKPPAVLKQIANGRDPMDGEIVQYLKDSGMKNPPADLVAAIRTNAVEPDGNTISAFRDGVRESYKTTDSDLVNAFKQLDQQSAGLLIKILALPAKGLRAGAVLTPDFMAKNLIRDFTTAFVNSKGVFTPLDTISGLKSVIAKDASFQDWLKSGGANSAMVALDRRYMQESIEKLTAETGLGNRAWNVVKSPLDGLRMLSELTENATRLGEFKKVLGESKSKADIQDAGFRSRELTLDFARKGASTQAYNMITAFANANIQGVDRIGRAFKDNPVGTTLKVAGGITLPSVLLWYANHDDPRYKELPQWQRDLFWIILTKDHVWRIPKDFSMGVMFGSGAERVLDRFYGHNPDAFKGFGGSVASTLLPGATPTFAQPIIEQFANRSTFTNRTLIPDLMTKGLPEYQYTPYTTELAKSLGSIIGAFPGIKTEKLEDTALGGVARSMTSPIMIENYIRTWTGGLGMYALQAADASLRKAGILPDPPKPASTLADIPFIKAFAVRYPSSSAQSIQDFTDDYSKNRKYYTSFMEKAKEGDVAAMGRIQNAGGPRIFLQLDGINTALAQHSQLIRDIVKDPSMPGEQKRQLIDQLYYSMIQIGQQGKAALNQIDKALTAPQSVVNGPSH